jgi:hypothetical protein
MNMKSGLKPLGEMIAAAALAALAALAAPVHAQTVGQEPLGAPRVPQTHSVEQANATLEQVARERAVVNDEFAASERVCAARFFVNNCLDKAKEKRRAALAGLRAVEVEAQHFKRADSVAKRDADLAERARKDAEDQAQRAAHAPREPKVVDDKPPAPPSGRKVADREAEHAARLKREQAQEAADAGKRAANVEAFERKQVESGRRQAAVAKKKAENAARAAAKEASDKKRAEAEAAAAAAAAAKAASK